MTRAAAFLLALALSLPARADMYQDARNATLPQALFNLGAMARDATNALLPEARVNLGITPLTVQDYGGVCDGTFRALSTVYPTLAAAQAVYPFVTATTQGLDWAAATKAVNATPRSVAVRGTCALKEPLFLPANTTISGVSGGDGFVAVAGFTPPGVNGVLTVVDDVSDVTVRGLKIDAAGLAFSGIYNEGGSGKRTHVENNWIINPTDSGVYVRSARYVTVTGNNIDTPGLHCVVLTTTAQDFNVSNNNCFDPGGAGVIFSIGIKGVITGNRVLNPGTLGPGNGDGVTGYSSSNYDVVVSNNMITDSANHGIHVSGSRISVTGNVIETTNAGGIFFGDSNVAAPYGPSYQSVIANNIVRNAQNTHAISVHNFHDGAITGNVVSGTASVHAGYLLRESTRNTISGNVSEGGLGQGYFLQGVTGNVFTGNLSHNNASYGYRIGQSDVSATQSTGNTFSGNVSDGDTLSGISEVDTSTGNTFANNRIIGNAAGPYMGKASALTVVDNVPLTAKGDYDPPSLAVGTTATTTFAVPGAQTGDRAEVSMAASTDLTASAVVSAPDTVTVKVWNNTGGVRDLPLTGFYVWVWQK